MNFQNFRIFVLFIQLITVQIAIVANILYLLTNYNLCIEMHQVISTD